MIGSGDSAPYDFFAFAVLCILAVALLAGAIAGPSWAIAANILFFAIWSWRVGRW